jgi:hypothetical protein
MLVSVLASLRRIRGPYCRPASTRCRLELLLSLAECLLQFHDHLQSKWGIKIETGFAEHAFAYSFVGQDELLHCQWASTQCRLIVLLGLRALLPLPPIASAAYQGVPFKRGVDKFAKKEENICCSSNKGRNSFKIAELVGR